jgi:large subunit ribosomal protein L24
MKLHTNDQVQIQIGKDKGKTGKITRVLTKENKVLVDGVNQFKRHIKARMQGQKSEIITITKPLDVAKVALICPHCKKQTRVGYIIENNEKVRVCRKCNKKI